MEERTIQNSFLQTAARKAVPFLWGRWPQSWKFLSTLTQHPWAVCLQVPVSLVLSGDSDPNSNHGRSISSRAGKKKSAFLLLWGFALGATLGQCMCLIHRPRQLFHPSRWYSPLVALVPRGLDNRNESQRAQLC